MAGGISALSLTAAVLYVGVALACMAACGVAASRRQPIWNRKVWLALALLFLLLFVLRGFALEEAIRTALRNELRTDGLYDGRRSVQGIIAAALILLFGAAGSFLFLRAVRSVRGRRNTATMAALAAGGAMIFLVLLRIVSLHMIDRALYAFKFNWVIDIGTTMVVLGGAIYYIRLVTARP